MRLRGECGQGIQGNYVWVDCGSSFKLIITLEEKWGDQRKGEKHLAAEVAESTK
jgi:hypothetical protein